MLCHWKLYLERPVAYSIHGTQDRALDWRMGKWCLRHRESLRGHVVIENAHELFLLVISDLSRR